MFYLIVFRSLLLILVLVAFYTQVLVPLYKGTKLFPWFSSKRTKLEKEFTGTREEIELHHLEDDLQNLKKSDPHVKAEVQNSDSGKTP